MTILLSSAIWTILLVVAFAGFSSDTFVWFASFVLFSSFLPQAVNTSVSDNAASPKIFLFILIKN